MVRVYNSSIVERVRDIFGLKTDPQEFNECDDVLNAVVVVEQEMNVHKFTTSTTGMFTVPNDKDFYLTSASVSATADDSLACVPQINFILADGTISAVGFTLSLGLGAVVTTNQTQEFTFSKRGLKIKRGTTISSDLANASAGFFTITGYTESVKDGA